LILLPQNIEVHIAPELVTVWEESATTENTLGEHGFLFNTGSQTIEEGTSPYVEVWSGDPVALNTTFALLLDGTTPFNMNITDNPATFMIPG